MKSTTVINSKQNHTDFDELEIYHMLASKWAQKIEQTKRPKLKKYKNQEK